MEKTIAGKSIDVNEEGYMTNYKQWSREVGEALAAEANIKMTDRHWAVINYLQDQYTKDIPLSIRKIRTSGVIDIKEFYELYPEGPLKTSAKIAGIPKPASCI